MGLPEIYKRMSLPFAYGLLFRLRTWTQDGDTEELLVRVPIQVAVPEREHSANARDIRRLRRMAKTKGRFHVLPHPLVV